MVRDEYIDYDLENYPLQIKTDSDVQEKEEIYVWFYHHAQESFAQESFAQESFAGSFLLSFSAPKYKLGHCSESWTDFPTDLPSEIDKLWTITLLKTAKEIRVVVHCNDKEVLNVVLSDTTCSDESWSTPWTRDVDQLKFDSSDTASDFYRPGKLLDTGDFYMLIFSRKRSK